MENNRAGSFSTAAGSLLAALTIGDRASRPGTIVVYKNRGRRAVGRLRERERNRGRVDAAAAATPGDDASSSLAAGQSFSSRSILPRADGLRASPPRHKTHGKGRVVQEARRWGLYLVPHREE